MDPCGGADTGPPKPTRRNAAYWPVPHDLLSLHFYTAQDHLLKAGTTHSGYIQYLSIINKTASTDMANLVKWNCSRGGASFLVILIGVILTKTTNTIDNQITSVYLFLTFLLLGKERENYSISPLYTLTLASCYIVDCCLKDGQ